MKAAVRWCIVLAIAGLGFWAQAAYVRVPHLVPRPQEVKPLAGEPFELTAQSGLYVQAAEAFSPMRTAQFALGFLREATGLPLREVARWDGQQPLPAGSLLFCARAGLGPEAYELEVGQEFLRIVSSTEAGAFYGFQTFLQLLPPEVYAKGRGVGLRWRAAAVKIRDWPRFAWRGLHVDECRHFMGPEALRAMIDAMAAHKMNTLHWHLTDDQGWRLEIRRFPELTAKGARRASSPCKGDRARSDGQPYGPFFYTQAQVKELLAYAAERQVTIVPEIEMPGHAQALLAAFPELGCTGGPYEPWCGWGVSDEIACAGNDQTLRVYEQILDEVLALFPSVYIHCGGDEAPKRRWSACPKCQARMAREGLKDPNRLQTWFMQHFADYLEARGRHMIGWDEILDGGLPKGAAVMSWRGAHGGIQAASQGHRVVMSPNSHAYLDYGQGLPDDPHEYIGGKVTLRQAYALNPTDGIPSEMHPFVLGVQGNLWSEYIWSPKEQQWKAWPRAAALAEVGWSAQESRCWPLFRARVKYDLLRLRAMGIHCAPLPTEAPEETP